MLLILSGALKGIDGLKAAGKWSMRRLPHLFHHDDSMVDNDQPDQRKLLKN